MSVVIRLVVRLTDWPTPIQESLVSSVRPLLQSQVAFQVLKEWNGSFQPSWGREGDGINKSKHLRGHELSFKKPHVTCPQTVWESGNIRHHVISMLYSLFGFQNTDFTYCGWCTSVVLRLRSNLHLHISKPKQRIALSVLSSRKWRSVFTLPSIRLLCWTLWYKFIYLTGK